MAKSKSAKDLRAEPQDLQQQIAELTADLQRVHADFVNYRRRNDEERAQLMQVAKANAITQLLPLIDNLERALSHMPAELADNQWAKGIAQLVKQLETILKNLGVEKIAALGRPFDPNLHEAVSYDSDGDGEEMVAEVLQDGYKLGDQVIRHVMVKVGSRAANEKKEN